MQVSAKTWRKTCMQREHVLTEFTFCMQLLVGSVVVKVQLKLLNLRAKKRLSGFDQTI